MRRSPHRPALTAATATVAMGLALAACSGGGTRRHLPAAIRSTTTSTVAPAGSSADIPPSSDTTSSTAAPASGPAPTTASTVARPVTTTSALRRATATTARPASATTAATATTAPGSGTAPGTGPAIGGCPVFPADNAWNQDVRSLPVDPRSATYVAAISAGGRRFLHADFGSDPSYGIPWVATSTAPAVPVTYDEYGDESDPRPFPIPLDAPVESGSDAHVLTIDTRSCTLFELYRARRSGSGWLAGSGARFDLRSDALRPDTWTSADAAGLPILPGLVRYDEVQAGEIRHALRFTVDRSQNGFIHPATHQAGKADTTLPPMGLRLRLRADVDLSAFHGEAKVVLTALQRYGMIVADNGSSWFISGATDRHRQPLGRHRPRSAEDGARLGLRSGHDRCDPALTTGSPLGAAPSRRRPAMTHVAMANEMEMIASVMCTTRKPAPWVWSFSMLRISTPHTKNDHSEKARSTRRSRRDMPEA